MKILIFRDLGAQPPSPYVEPPLQCRHQTLTTIMVSNNLCHAAIPLEANNYNLHNLFSYETDYVELLWVPSDAIRYVGREFKVDPDCHLLYCVNLLTEYSSAVKRIIVRRQRVALRQMWLSITRESLMLKAVRSQAAIRITTRNHESSGIISLLV